MATLSSGEQKDVKERASAQWPGDVSAHGLVRSNDARDFAITLLLDRWII